MSVNCSIDLGTLRSYAELFEIADTLACIRDNGNYKTNSIHRESVISLRNSAVSDGDF